MTSIGINLAAVTYYGTEYPFLDRFKTSERWSATNSAGGVNSPVPLDSEGYPTNIPAGATSIYTMVGVDPLSAGTDHRYVLTYSGTGKISFSGVTVVSSKPGEIVLDYTGVDNRFQLRLDSISDYDPISAIHVVREDQVDLYNSGEIFNPDFLERISPFNTLRFMDWANTNASLINDWSSRPTLSSASWASGGNNGGTPIEVIVALANESDNNVWLNIPTQATDDYVRSELEYVRDHLNPRLNVSVEYSNEVWNFAFPQSHYALQMGDRLWGRDINGDGHIDSSNSSPEHVGDGWVQYYGFRSAQIASISNSVFSSAPNRLSNVLAVQTYNPSLDNSMFNGVAKAGVGSVPSLFKQLAVTTYFGGGLNGATAADRAIVLGWAHSGSSGLAAAFNQMENGGTLSFKNSLADLPALYAAHKLLADKYHLDLVAYEGGVGFDATQYNAADQATIVDFESRLDNDPRMGVLYEKMIAQFAAAGGVQLNAYNDVGNFSVFGTWGALPSIYDESSPRYDALTTAAIKDALLNDPLGKTAVDAHIDAAYQSFAGRAATLGELRYWENTIRDAGNDFSVLRSDSLMAARDRADVNAPAGASATSTRGLVQNDFNGDGKSDVLWRNSAEVGTWLTTGNGNFVVHATLYSASSDWKVAGTGDFNGDGKTDLLWRNDDGRIGDWLSVADGAFKPNTTLTQVSADWQVIGTGDFNGDGRTDVLWRNAGGSVGTWSADANGNFMANAALYSVESSWRIEGTGDFNGDGRADILWRNSMTGQLGDWLANSGGTFSPNATLSSAPLNWHVAQIGDFNGDGQADILWRSDAGQVGDWLADAKGNFTPNATLAVAALDWKIVEAGDYDGDGRTDVLWRNSITGETGSWLADAGGNFAPNHSLYGASLDWNVPTDHTFLV